MYLYKKTFVGSYYPHLKIKAKISITEDGKPIHINETRISEIVERVGYWRKSNAVHGWFVDNVQAGEDDCREYPVSIEQLKELLELCYEVLKNPDDAEHILPAHQGFFFGSYDYGIDYMTDIKDTIKILEPLLQELKEEKKQNIYSEIYYQSSW